MCSKTGNYTEVLFDQMIVNINTFVGCSNAIVSFIPCAHIEKQKAVVLHENDIWFIQ